jgi:hypothetical protein
MLGGVIDPQRGGDYEWKTAVSQIFAEMDGTCHAGKKVNYVDCLQGGIPMIVQRHADSVERQMFKIFAELLLTAARCHERPRICIKEHAHLISVHNTWVIDVQGYQLLAAF